MTTKPDDSHVDVREHGTAFVGADAVNLYRAITLKHALIGYAKFKMVPTRGVTASSLLALAKEFTGKTYKRGEHLKASEDVATWVETMKAALPTSHS